MSSSTSPKQNDAREIYRKMQEGERLRAQQRREAEQEKKLAAEQKKADKAARKSSKESTSHYIANFLLAAFFIILPLGEKIIDWKHVGAAVILNAAWNLLFHENTWLHVGLLFICNVALINLTVVWEHIPGMIAKVPPEYLAAFVVGNGVIILIVYFAYIRPKPAEERFDAWDIFLVVLMIANVAVLVATGVIPPQVLYQVFKSVTGLLSNFQMQ